MPSELYRKYRPQNWDEVMGQQEVVQQLRTMVEKKKVPHVVLISGGTGQGKTSLLRILARELGIHHDDIREYNIADSRGIDTIREINQTMDLYGMVGRDKCYLLDEVGELNSFGQKALLKSLEDTPDHVYFMLATTDPQKLIPTVRNRCSKYEIKPLGFNTMRKLIKKILHAEEKELTEEVLEELVNHANGSAREALVTLEQILYLEGYEQQIQAISKIPSDIKQDIFELVRVLLWKPPSWNSAVTKIINTIDDFEPIRKLILSNAANELLKVGDTKRAAKVIEQFESDFFSSGKAGFALACYRSLS